MKKIIVLFGILLIVSCGTKKKVFEKVVERDSISYVLPSENSLVISNLCDTLNRPLEVVKTISTGVSTSKVEIKGNTLTIKTKTDTIFKDKITYREKIKLETKEVPYIPKWFKTLFWLVTSLLVIVIAFPKIAEGIKNVIGKLIIGKI